MSIIAEQIRPETFEFIKSLADDSGLSVDEYLRQILPVSEQNLALKSDDLEELKADLAAFEEGTEELRIYDGSYSREDIYFDHD